MQVIWELQCLGLQHPIISIFGSTIFRDLLDLLFGRAHILRTLSNVQAGDSFCSDGAQQKTSASKLLIFWFLYKGFYCVPLTELRQNTPFIDLWHTYVT